MVVPSARASSHRVLVLAFILAACGETTRNADGSAPEGGTTATATPAPGTGGTGGFGASAGSISLAGQGVAGAGIGGTMPPAKPNINISGRWGMFSFEDPVGVLITQTPDGTLRGRGCASEAPGSSLLGDPAPVFCGDLSGTVHGNRVEFQFPPVLDRVYATRVTVSEDGKRMAGTFDSGGGNLMKVSWLRVADDAPWLPPGPSTFDEPLAGTYTLTLVETTGKGGDFAAGTSYRVSYSRRTLLGDLGTFWNTEISDPNAGTPLRVGPVPATDPGLPMSLELDFGSTGFTGIRAVTPSGSSYTFSAKQP